MNLKLSQMLRQNFTGILLIKYSNCALYFIPIGGESFEKKVKSFYIFY
jgi:hypothetical protein